MSPHLLIAGIDPGRTTGIAMLGFNGSGLSSQGLLQVTPNMVPGIIAHAIDCGARVDARRVIAVERFVVSQRAGRSADSEAGEITRNLIGMLAGFKEAYGIEVFLRSAAEVKPWASEKRLKAAGIKVSNGWGHALDGARHALFSAVHDHGVPDPLSKHYGVETGGT